MGISPGLLGFGEWRPDVSDLNTPYAKVATNVVPRADGYGPFPSFTGFTEALSYGNDSYTKVLLHFDGTDASTTITVLARVP